MGHSRSRSLSSGHKQSLGDTEVVLVIELRNAIDTVIRNVKEYGREETRDHIETAIVMIDDAGAKRSSTVSSYDSEVERRNRKCKMKEIDRKIEEARRKEEADKRAQEQREKERRLQEEREREAEAARQLEARVKEAFEAALVDRAEDLQAELERRYQAEIDRRVKSKLDEIEREYQSKLEEQRRMEEEEKRKQAELDKILEENNRKLMEARRREFASIHNCQIDKIQLDAIKTAFWNFFFVLGLLLTTN
ncbi:PERQ amino acid-rich with GYF domain-containing protein [Schistosoma japonicum]|uniref:PERQ amino acid-rich with GYF domain-containing protein n=1 Tax=Schistosoma japonicum TaxID=6182 RepID=A0A4Z2DPF1_SCHJA|nr:PERQ amino acid-rich with GYF domain-containing protein [Schistosoma japonicum]